MYSLSYHAAWLETDSSLIRPVAVVRLAGDDSSLVEWRCTDLGGGDLNKGRVSMILSGRSLNLFRCSLNPWSPECNGAFPGAERHVTLGRYCQTRP